MQNNQHKKFSALHARTRARTHTHTQYFPAHKTHFFPRKIQPASYVPRVSIISKIINTRTSIIQHFYHEIVKFASKS